MPKGRSVRLEVFTNTFRQYWIYVPAHYDASKPAALMVFQDGHKYVNTEEEYRVPVVFDNLIAKGQMPVTIALFVNPGHSSEQWPERWRESNRANEYDALGDQYAQLLIDELIPEIAKKYKITPDPEGHAIGGASSGGICAFTAAWERPDYFRKVISHIGSFVSIRGGHVYPTLIRQRPSAHPRVPPGRSTDLDNRWGNWPLANQSMAAALQFRGYDYRFEFGDGAHTHKHGGHCCRGAEAALSGTIPSL